MVSRLIRIPGMIDPHVHLRDLNWSHKATFASETTAALAGGYWTVLDMPNTPPSTVTRAALETKLNRISASAMCDWGLYFGASQDGNQGEYPHVAGQVCGLKIYNNATTGTLLIADQGQRDRHYRAWPAGKVIAVHAEGETVGQILDLVRQHRKPTHFCHISTASEIDLLKQAKEEGLPVSVGVTPHHLFLTIDDLPALGSLGLMKPELKTKSDRDALWSGLQSGIIDVVESDHAPHTLAEKASDKPPYGVPGLETTLPLLCTAAQEGRLSHDRIIELVATNPQRIFGLYPDVDTYTVVDVAERYVIERGRLRTACGWSPFEGVRVWGRVREVWIRWQLAFDGESVRVKPGFGRNVIGLDR